MNSTKRTGASAIAFGVVILAACLHAPAQADRSFRVCIGEDPNKCPVAHTSFFGCGTSMETAAKVVCTVKHTSSQTVLDFQIIPQGKHSGGRCGYDWAEVNCEFFQLNHRVCIGEHSHKCPVAASSFFGCGTSPDAAAIQVCSVYHHEKTQNPIFKGQATWTTVMPYKIAPQGTHSGGQCGYDWYGVTCEP